MRKGLMAFAIVYAVLFAPLVVATHPKRFVDWVFYAGAVFVIVAVVFGSSGAASGLNWSRMGGLHFLPRRNRRDTDRPDEYDYPDSGL